MKRIGNAIERKGAPIKRYRYASQIAVIPIEVGLAQTTKNLPNFKHKKTASFLLTVTS